MAMVEAVLYAAIIIAIIIFAIVSSAAYYFAGVKGIVGAFAIIPLAIVVLKMKTSVNGGKSRSLAGLSTTGEIGYRTEPTPISATVVANIKNLLGTPVALYNHRGYNV
jgi:hypothetical protein